MSEKDASTPSKSDLSFLTPGPDAQADPYYAIMGVNAQGQTTGQIWSLRGQLMLFKYEEDADQVLLALAENDRDNQYALRGVTKRHLAMLQDISRKNKVPLSVVNGIEPDGRIDAAPLE